MMEPSEAPSEATAGSRRFLRERLSAANPDGALLAPLSYRPTWAISSVWPGMRHHAEQIHSGSRRGPSKGAGQMQIATPLSGELAQYLDLSSAELKLTAQNMANLDTPGYRTQGFDFAAEMERSVAEAGWGRRGPGKDVGPAVPQGRRSGWAAGAAGWEQRLDRPRGAEYGRGAAAVSDWDGVAEA